MKSISPILVAEMVIGAVLLTGCARQNNSPATVKPLSASTAAALDEARSTFTYDGHPIHPGLVREFLPWISDGQPIVIAVDVEAAEGTDEFDPSTVEIDGNCVGYAPEFDDDDGDEDDDEAETWFEYERLGALDDGTQVLRTVETSGGSGSFNDLILVRFEIGRGFDADGKPYDQLLMRIVRDVPLGDRDDGRIDIRGDRILVGPSKYRAQPLVVFTRH